MIYRIIFITLILIILFWDTFNELIIDGFLNWRDDRRWAKIKVNPTWTSKAGVVYQVIHNHRAAMPFTLVSPTGERYSLNQYWHTNVFYINGSDDHITSIDGDVAIELIDGQFV